MGTGPTPLPVNVSPPLGHLMDDPLWRAEFCGFFWGEGWLGINRFQTRRNGKTANQYRPEVMITQSVENRAVVEHIRDVLGGYVYERAAYVHGSDKQLRGPYYTWQARSQMVARRAVDILSGDFYFPDKKSEKVTALGEFLDILTEYGGKTKPPEVIVKIEELRAITTPKGKPLVDQ